MEFYDLIRTRESVRNYDPEQQVSMDVLKRILEAGRLAPSACNIQPWRFLVISSPEKLENVRSCYHRQWFKDAPHILIIVGKKDAAWKRGFDGYNSIETDVAIAMTHIILAAENEGIGTCWIANYNPELLNEALNLQEGEIIFGITPLGYQREGYKKSGLKTRRSLDEITEFL
jgi:nitroreductase